MDRHVGIISAKGPNNGRMKISAGARTVSVDLHAVRWTPRQLVAEVMVPAGVALVITNDSPATGTRRDVHVDGLATLSLGHYRSADPAADSPPPARASAAAESITAAIPVGSTLAPVPTTFSIDLTAKVHGCPQGCAIVAVDDGFDEQTLLTHTSPATPGLETLRIRVPAPPWVWYELRKNGTEVVSTGILGGELVQDAFLLYSHGWVRDANGTTIGDSIMRSSTRRTGATYRVSGTWEGRDVGVIAAKGPRNGVMAIYVNGVLRQTVDLKSATWQPRLIVAAVELPLRGRITLVNATPAGRVAADVHVDGLAILDHPEDWYRTAS